MEVVDPGAHPGEHDLLLLVGPAQELRDGDVDPARPQLGDRLDERPFGAATGAE